MFFQFLKDLSLAVVQKTSSVLDEIAHQTGQQLDQHRLSGKPCTQHTPWPQEMLWAVSVLFRLRSWECRNPGVQGERDGVLRGRGGSLVKSARAVGLTRDSWEHHSPCCWGWGEAGRDVKLSPKPSLLPLQPLHLHQPATPLLLQSCLSWVSETWFHTVLPEVEADSSSLRCHPSSFCPQGTWMAKLETPVGFGDKAAWAHDTMAGPSSLQDESSQLRTSYCANRFYSHVATQ